MRILLVRHGQSEGNVDIIELAGERKNWSFTKIYDGRKHKAVNKNILEGIKRFGVSDLPAVPDFLKP